MIVGLFFLYSIYYGKSGYKELEKWAKRKGFTILNYELRHFKTGPYFFSDRKRIQRVFYVTLEDKDGTSTKAWVKIGGTLGLLSNEVEVKWDG